MKKNGKGKNVNNKIKCKTGNLCDGKEVWDKKKTMTRKHIKKDGGKQVLADQAKKWSCKTNANQCNGIF